MADPAEHADCEEIRGIADDERLPTGSARRGQTTALERLRARDEEDEQSDEDERLERRQRRAEQEEREEREEEEERQEREEEAEREEEERQRVEEAWRWQMEHEERQRWERDAIALTLGCLLVCQEATAAERRAGATKRKRLNRKRHATASVREESFRRKYCMDEPAFNKLVEILRPVIEADETYARDRDVFYLREAGVQYPQLAELTQKLMPDEVAEEAGMTASSDGGGESSGGDDDDDGDNGGGRNASISEAHRLKTKSRARQATIRRQKKAKESIAEYMPALRRELEAMWAKSTSTTVAPAALDTERALKSLEAEINLQKAQMNLQKARMNLQKARTGKAKAEKEMVTRENRRQARAEYKRLRNELRKEEAEPERDEALIAVLKGAAAFALKSMKGDNDAPDA